MIDKGLYKKAPAAKSQLVYESDKRLGYRGAGGYRGGSGGSGGAGGREDPASGGGGGNNNNQGGGGGGNNNNRGGGADLSTVKTLPPVMTTLPSNIPAVDTTLPYNPAGVIASTVPMDIKEQYRVGNNISIVPGLGPVTVMDQPYSSLGLEQQRYDNFVDARNLEGATLPKTNTGLLTLDTVLNAAAPFRNFMFNINKNFFAENVAGKYGYGYGFEDYKQYMKDRMSGKVSAYGNPALGQNEINRRSDDGGGIMQVRQINPLIPIEDEEENQTAKNYDFNYGTASNPIYYSDLV